MISVSVLSSQAAVRYNARTLREQFGGSHSVNAESPDNPYNDFLKHPRGNHRANSWARTINGPEALKLTESGRDFARSPIVDSSGPTDTGWSIARRHRRGRFERPYSVPRPIQRAIDCAPPVSTLSHVARIQSSRLLYKGER